MFDSAFLSRFANEGAGGSVLTTSERMSSPRLDLMFGLVSPFFFFPRLHIRGKQAHQTKGLVIQETLDDGGGDGGGVFLLVLLGSYTLRSSALFNLLRTRSILSPRDFAPRHMPDMYVRVFRINK